MRTNAIGHHPTMKIAGITLSVFLAAAALPACGVQSDPGPATGTTNSRGPVDRTPPPPQQIKNQASNKPAPGGDTAPTTGKQSATGENKPEDKSASDRPAAGTTSVSTPPAAGAAVSSTSTATPPPPPAANTNNTATGTDEPGENTDKDDPESSASNPGLIGDSINDNLSLPRDKNLPLSLSPQTPEPEIFDEPTGINYNCAFPAPTEEISADSKNCPNKKGLFGKQADRLAAGRTYAEREQQAADDLFSQMVKARDHFGIRAETTRSDSLNALAYEVARAQTSGQDPTAPIDVSLLPYGIEIRKGSHDRIRPESVTAEAVVAHLLQSKQYRDVMLWNTPIQVGTAVVANRDTGVLMTEIIVKVDRERLPVDDNCMFPQLDRSSWEGYSPFKCPGVREVQPGSLTQQQNNALLPEMRTAVRKQLEKAAAHYGWAGTITEDAKLTAAVQDLAAHPKRTSKTYIFPYAGVELSSPVNGETLNTASYPAETLVAILLTSYHDSLPKVMTRPENKFIGVGLAPLANGNLSFYISVRLDDGQGGPCDFSEFPEPKKNAQYDHNGSTAGRVNYCGAFSLPTAADARRPYADRVEQARHRILAQLNKIRRQAGVPEVTTVNPVLTDDAQDWAQKRLDQGLDRHQTANEFAYGRIEKEVMDDSYLPVGGGPETIKPEILIADYLYSPHHREAILNPNMKQIGIGIAIDGKTGKLINVINFLNREKTPVVNPNWRNY